MTVLLLLKSASHLLQKNKEGDIGAQCGCHCALAGDQVETFGRLDGTLLPPGCVLCADPGCTVIRDHFSVAVVGKTSKQKKKEITQKALHTGGHKQQRIDAAKRQ